MLEEIISARAPSVAGVLGRLRFWERLRGLEEELARLRASLPETFAPASEVGRLNQAFEEIAQRAPISEVERLNQAFEELTELRQRLTHWVRDLVMSERSVEIPWVLSGYGGERRVLEVGYAYAEPRYVDALVSLQIPALVGLDLVPARDARYREVFKGVVGDVRDSVFSPDSFDLILCISTIEHVGRDNSIYGIEDGERDDAGDRKAMVRLAEWLAPGGRLLLSVPFGRFEDHGWLINYDADRLDALVRLSGLALISELYYEQRGGWVPCGRDELRHRGYRSLGVPHAGGVALLELKRTP